jgi:hypothetical protein
MGSETVFLIALTMGEMSLFLFKEVSNYFTFPPVIIYLLKK